MTENILNNRSEQLSVEGLEILINDNYSNEDYLLLDSRTVEEYEKGTIPGAINYPLDELRQHVDFIKSLDKKVVIFCQKGLRGYLAELILRNNGVTNVVNVGGGFKIWQMYSDQIEIPEPVLVKK